jgi:hypothetical protein
VADDGDEEWVVEVADVTRRPDSRGIEFPDNDGSLLGFLPTDPGAFLRALTRPRRTASLRHQRSSNA